MSLGLFGIWKHISLVVKALSQHFGFRRKEKELLTSGYWNLIDAGVIVVILFIAILRVAVALGGARGAEKVALAVVFLGRASLRHEAAVDADCASVLAGEAGRRRSYSSATCTRGPCSRRTARCSTFSRSGRTTAALSRVVQEVLVDSLPITSIMLFLMLGFTITFWILDDGHEEENYSPLDVFFEMFYWTLGNVEGKLPIYAVTKWWYVLLFIFFITIVMANALIAITGETLERVRGNIGEQMQRAKAMINSDLESAMYGLGGVSQMRSLGSSRHFHLLVRQEQSIEQVFDRTLNDPDSVKERQAEKRDADLRQHVRKLDSRLDKLDKNMQQVLSSMQQVTRMLHEQH